jgi:hypothetical protein
MIDIAGRSEIEALTRNEIETRTGSETRIETGIGGSMKGQEGTATERRSAMELHELVPAMDTAAEIMTMSGVAARARKKMTEIVSGTRTESASAIENGKRTETVPGIESVKKSGSRSAWVKRGTGRNVTGIGIGVSGTVGRRPGTVKIGGLTAARERGLELAPGRRSSRVKILSLS